MYLMDVRRVSLKLIRFYEFAREKEMVLIFVIGQVTPFKN